MGFTYKICIKPVGTYFLGGEKTFVDDDERANYRVESRPIPQQTTILGMLRYALRSGLLPLKNSDDKLELTQLIGAYGFDGTDRPIGIIERLSPLFLWHEKYGLMEEAGLYFQPEDKEKWTQIQYRPWKAKSVISGVVNRQALAPRLLAFDYKHERPKAWRYKMNEGENILTYDKIFFSKEQVGNLKNREDIDDDKGFFKQIRYSMAKEFSFCMYVQTEKELKDDVSFLAFMGGDQSEFRVKISKEDFSFEVKLEEYPESEGRVVLLSDCFMPEELLRYCEFALIDTLNFRYIRTLTKMTDFSDIDRKKYVAFDTDEKRTAVSQLPRKSEDIKLVTRGAVFYCHNVNKFVEGIINHPFHRIGYNYCRIEL